LRIFILQKETKAAKVFASLGRTESLFPSLPSVYINLPSVHHDLWRRPIHFQLVVDLSDLLGLLLQLRSELFNLLLLFLNLSVLFEEFVEQHRVHGVVTVNETPSCGWKV
jgi:hypothetical protein